MTPRRHPRRPKIDPRRLQDDLQELLFSTSFLSSILVPLGSDFCLILPPLEAPKCARSAHLVGFKTTLKAHDGPRWPQDRPRRPQDPPRCPKSRPRAPQRPPRPPQNDQKSTQDPPKTTENRFILRLLLSSSSPFFFSLLVLLSSLFSLRSSLCFPFSSLFASLLFLFSSLLFSSLPLLWGGVSPLGPLGALLGGSWGLLGRLGGDPKQHKNNMTKKIDFEPNMGPTILVFGCPNRSPNRPKSYPKCDKI